MANVCNPFENASTPKDEFAGMNAKALEDNIKLQERRLTGGIVDTSDKYEIESLIARMKMRLSQLTPPKN